MTLLILGEYIYEKIPEHAQAGGDKDIYMAINQQAAAWKMKNTHTKHTPRVHVSVKTC